MARPLRIVKPGLWHHVMNRGGGGRSINGDDRDREKFLSLLSEIGDRWGVYPTAYCRMTSHYHALLLDEGGKLSRAMRHIDGVYTQWFNRRHGSDGALMRGRFRSRVVQAEDYVAEVVRYIHTNPIGPGMAACAGDYRWSSHRAYMGRRAEPWCHCDAVLDLMQLAEPYADLFDAFVHERIDEERSNLIGGTLWAPILGDDAFVQTCRKLMRQSGNVDVANQPSARRLVGCSPDAIIDIACKHFGLERSALLTGARGRLNLPRLITLLLCVELTPARGAELSSHFGVAPRTVSHLAGRARRMVQQDDAAGAALSQLRRAVESEI